MPALTYVLKQYSYVLYQLLFSVLGQNTQHRDLMGRNVFWLMVGRDVVFHGDKARWHAWVKARTAINKEVKTHRGFV